MNTFKDPIRHYTKANRATYDKLAQEYESKVAVRQQHNTKVVDRFVQYITTGRRVLDIGCAVGLDIQLFCQRGFEVVGIEVSKEMAAFAKIRNPEAAIMVGDFSRTRFKEEFDAIWAQAFIHLFPKTEASKLLKQIFQALKPGGVMYITTTRSNTSSEGWVEKADYQGAHKRFRKFWTRPELVQALQDVKFKVVDEYVIADPYGKEWMVFTVRR